jgi:hypothetical protein
MNFYRRKFVFLISSLLLITFFLLSPNREYAGKNNFSPKEIVSNDTTRTTENTARVIREKDENIFQKDQGSPKTVNFILYLIYRFTFKNVN